MSVSKSTLFFNRTSLPIISNLSALTPSKVKLKLSPSTSEAETVPRTEPTDKSSETVVLPTNANAVGASFTDATVIATDALDVPPCPSETL